MDAADGIKRRFHQQRPKLVSVLEENSLVSFQTNERITILISNFKLLSLRIITE